MAISFTQMCIRMDLSIKFSTERGKGLTKGVEGSTERGEGFTERREGLTK